MIRKTAVCPGSFDPVTFGHMDIIKRAAAMFDRVIVAVMNNPAKNPSFSTEERIALLHRVMGELPNVEIDCFDELLVDFARKKSASVIIKGLRALSDFEYEFQMALTNRKLEPEIETVFLTTLAENMYLSSSMVKQVAHFGGDISSFVPACIHDEIKERLCKQGGNQ